MCSHYQGIKEHERYIRYFGVEPPDDLGKVDLWPGYQDWLEVSTEHSMKFMMPIRAADLQAVAAGATAASVLK